MPDVEEEIEALENLFDDDMESIITNGRYVYIGGIIDLCVKKGRKKGALTISDSKNTGLIPTAEVFFAAATTFFTAKSSPVPFSACEKG